MALPTHVHIFSSKVPFKQAYFYQNRRSGSRRAHKSSLMKLKICVFSEGLKQKQEDPVESSPLTFFRLKPTKNQSAMPTAKSFRKISQP
jgi:hypothetical protein